MKTLIAVGAVSLAAFGWPADDAPSAMERYDALVASTAKAAAIEYRFEGDFVYEVGGEKMSGKLEGEARMAWPNAGRHVFTFRIAGDEEEVVDRNEFIGTGEAVYALDEELMEAVSLGEEWLFAQPDSSPLHAFLMREVAEVVSVEQVMDDDLPGLLGLRVTLQEGNVETLWLDSKGSLKEIHSSLTDEGIHAETEMRVTGWKIHTEVNLEDYVVALPEGYEVIEEDAGLDDMSAGLLSVGASAPNVVLTGMDDVPLQLAALKGKTVLLNFWFYH